MTFDDSDTLQRLRFEVRAKLSKTAKLFQSGSSFLTENGIGPVLMFVRLGREYQKRGEIEKAKFGYEVARVSLRGFARGSSWEKGRKDILRRGKDVRCEDTKRDKGKVAFCMRKTRLGTGGGVRTGTKGCHFWRRLVENRNRENNPSEVKC